MKKIILIISAMILILLFDNVKASTYDNRWINGVQYKIQGGTYANTSFTNDLIHQFSLVNAGANRYFLKFNNNYTYTNGKELIFNVKFRVNEKDEITLSSTENSYKCTIQSTYHEYSFPSGNPDIEFEEKSFTCNSHYIDTSGTITEYKFSLSLQYWYNNNEDLRAPCYAKSNAGDIYSFTCPANQYNNVYGIVVQVSTPFQTNVTIGVSDLFTIETDTNQAIVEQQEQTNEIMNQTIEYNNETNTNTIGANETMQAGQMEDQLIAENEFNGSIMDGMTIDSSASGFIWQIMERLRSMNIAIVTLMTMALGLGVIKLVLNR